MLTIDGKQASITVPHGMDDDHYISHIWAKDEAGKVVASAELKPSDEPKLEFKVPEGVTTLTAFEAATSTLCGARSRSRCKARPPRREREGKSAPIIAVALDHRSHWSRETRAVMSIIAILSSRDDHRSRDLSRRPAAARGIDMPAKGSALVAHGRDGRCDLLMPSVETQSISTKPMTPFPVHAPRYTQKIRYKH